MEGLHDIPLQLAGEPEPVSGEGAQQLRSARWGSEL